MSTENYGPDVPEARNPYPTVRLIPNLIEVSLIDALDGFRTATITSRDARTLRDQLNALDLS